ncbi:MAG: error-prone DNA polymerase [Actinomycetota bacterium]
MGWSNGPLSWKEFHRRLSDGRPRPIPDWPPGAEGDSPAWSRKRQPYEPPPRFRSGSGLQIPYAELHCHSAFSFLDGASHPEALAEEAARLGLEALALTDHDGMYGVVRFAEAARAVGLPTIFGAELTVDAPRIPGGIADPDGNHLVAIARDPFGYARLCRAVSLAQLRGEKGRPVHDLAELSTLHGDRWLVLTGCRKGAVPRALVERGPSAARIELERLIDAFGRSNVVVELWDHGDPLDSHRNDTLAEIATDVGVELVATNNVHYATPRSYGLYTALAAVRARRSLDEIDGWLPPAGTAHLRSGAEQLRRFARYPGVVQRAAQLGKECAFDLRLIAPNLPPFPVPVDETEATWLRRLTYEGALRRYGARESERVVGAWAQIDRELHVIEQLGFPGYFLIVWDIVEFCRRNDILCQGRGSAANSAVCYALGITNADAVSLGLLFERFLSPARDGPPDIDVDIEAGRREEAIQYVYERFGRHNAAQVANVITYRMRAAVRDAGKALGHSQGQLDAWSKLVDGHGGGVAGAEGHGGGVAGAEDGLAEETGIPQAVLRLAADIEDLPRHLGIHSGGMVLCSRPVVEVCPVEWGRMENRSVLQWDKDDCAAAGLVKFDLLGLGMLTAIHEALDIVREAHGVDIDIATLPQDPKVYDMLCEADTVGVFQIESRAQMATLPRLKPRTFYDIVVEVALIRPGPIQGGSVHPYIRRRNGAEPITYLHPLLEPALRKTLGVPLFQEQLMQIAIDVAGFSAADADELRQAMGSKRSRERMNRLKDRFYDGMAKRRVTGDIADQIWDKLEAFANFGFPESHSVSFAYLVYISAWLKYHYPAAFCAALLNAQPMGFWSPHTLVADARRHGVKVLGVDVNASKAKATIEDEKLRLGIEYVRTIGEDLAKKIEAGRPYESVEDVAIRCELTHPQAEALATSGAFGCFDVSRRKTLWTAGAAAQVRQGQLPGLTPGADPPELEEMTEIEEAGADLWSMSMMPNGSPLQFVRDRLSDRGILTSEALKTWEHGRNVKVAGVVTHRQRPSTADGITFLNLEDETGLVNVICSRGVWRRYRRVARGANAMVVTGRLERIEGVTNLVAYRLEQLDLGVTTTSRDFR